MGLVSKIKAGAKAGRDALGDIAIRSLGWGILGAGVGVIGVGMWNAFVEGRYDGNLIEQAYYGIKDTIPFISHDPFWKVVSKDLSAGILVGSSTFLTRFATLVKSHTSQSYKEHETYEKQKDQIGQQAALQMYEIDKTAEVEAYRQRSPAHAG